MNLQRLTSRCQRGQASVELLAVMPVLVVVGLLAWQCAVAGLAWWRLSEAARIGARAVYVADQRGEPSAGRYAARRSAKALVGDDARVKVAEGEVRVASTVPLVWPFSAVGERSAPRLSAAAKLGG